MIDKIAILGAFKHEVSQIQKKLKKPEKTKKAGIVFSYGLLGSHKTVVGATGWGKVNASSGVTLAIETFKPDVLFYTGTAGTIPSTGLGVGDIVVSQSVLYTDIGLEADAPWRNLFKDRLPWLPLLKTKEGKFFHQFYPSQKLLERVKNVAEEYGANCNCKVRIGNISTSDTILTVNLTIAEEVYTQFELLCSEMEGAAAAQVCTRYGLPFLIVRGISDVSRRESSGLIGLLMEYRKNRSLAAKRAQEFLLRLVEHFS